MNVGGKNYTTKKKKKELHGKKFHSDSLPRCLYSEHLPYAEANKNILNECKAVYAYFSRKG